MDWQIMVIGQLSLLCVGTAGVCFWHIRKLRLSNQSLQAALEAAQGAEPAELSPSVEDGGTAEPSGDETPDNASDVGGGTATPGDSANDTAIADTEAPETQGSDSAPALDQPPQPSSNADASSDPGMEGLKKLLQQFTQDSRDMVHRIEQLESQTESLIQQAKATVDSSTESTTQAQSATSPEPAAADEEQQTEASTETEQTDDNDSNVTAAAGE